MEPCKPGCGQGRHAYREVMLIHSMLIERVDCTPGDAAGGERGLFWTTAWHPHRGLIKAYAAGGGGVAREAPQRPAWALPCPGPHTLISEELLRDVGGETACWR